MPTVIITGASTGIGAALSREMGRRGWKVGLVARRLDLLEGLADEIRIAGGTAAAASADVTDRASIDNACKALEAALGPCDLFVANAGSGSPASAQKVPIELTEDIMRLNYFGVLYSVGAVLGGMIERRSGRIAAVSSVAGFRGLPSHGAYCASKAAVSALFESWRIDLGGSGVGVTTIHPGFVATPLTAKNKFPMPFLISAEKAARICADGLEAGRTDITFPWQMRWFFKLFLVHMPNWIWDNVVGGSARKYK